MPKNENTQVSFENIKNMENPFKELILNNQLENYREVFANLPKKDWNQAAFLIFKDSTPDNISKAHGPLKNLKNTIIPPSDSKDKSSTPSSNLNQFHQVLTDAMDAVFHIHSLSDSKNPKPCRMFTGVSNDRFNKWNNLISTLIAGKEKVIGERLAETADSECLRDKVSKKFESLISNAKDPENPFKLTAAAFGDKLKKMQEKDSKTSKETPKAHNGSSFFARSSEENKSAVKVKEENSSELDSEHSNDESNQSSRNYFPFNLSCNIL